MGQDAERGGEPACWAHLFEPEGGADDDEVAELGDAALAQLVRDAGDAIVISDAQGRITFWNHAAERLFGWPASDAVGQTLDLIVPERQRARHWAGYEQTMRTGETKYGTDLLQVPSLHADGERRSIAFTVTLLHDGSPAPSGIAAIIRDETARRREDQALRQRVAEAGAG